MTSANHSIWNDERVYTIAARIEKNATPQRTRHTRANCVSVNAAIRSSVMTMYSL